jgi:hypothetical protein
MKHPHIEKTSSQSQIPEDVLWQSLLSSGGSTAASSSLIDAIRNEGSLSDRVGELTSMLHVFALSTVLQLDIVSLCPSTSLIYRSLLTARITPLRTTECCKLLVADCDSPLVIFLVMGCTRVSCRFHVSTESCSATVSQE